MEPTTKAAPATGTTTEARLPVTPGLEDLGDRISFMGVEVAKGKGGPLAPDANRFEKDNGMLLAAASALAAFLLMACWSTLPSTSPSKTSLVVPLPESCSNRRCSNELLT